MTFNITCVHDKNCNWQFNVSSLKEAKAALLAELQIPDYRLVFLKKVSGL